MAARANIVLAVLVVGAIALGALGFAGFGEDTANSLLFAAWSVALLALFALALRLPLRGSGSRLSAWISTILVTGAAIAIVVAANVALFRHDVHFDVSREGRNTPPSQLTTVIDNLRAPLSLTYFYNAGDVNALAAKELIAIAAHGHPLFAFRAIDLDKEPGLARDIGVRAYNTAVLQAGDRKVLVENTTDATRLAYAALRALKERVETVCFVTGHGETFRPTQAHFHYSHVETLKGHEMPGAGDVLVAAPEQLDRLQFALTEIGYEMRGIVTAEASAIPSDCAVVAEIGPRTAFAAGEADVLVKYLAGGGRAAAAARPAISRRRGARKPSARRGRRLQPSRPSSSTRSIIFAPTPTRWRCRIIRRTRSPSASRSRCFRRCGRSMSAAAARRCEHQYPRYQQPGQLPPAAVGRRRPCSRGSERARRRRPRRANTCGRGRGSLAGRRAR